MISDRIPLGRDGLPDEEAMIAQGRTRADALKIWAVAMIVPVDPKCEVIFIHPTPKSSQ